MKFKERKIQTLIRHAAKIRGVGKSRRRISGWPDEFQRRACELMGAGVRASELAARLGIHFTTLHGWKSELKSKSYSGGFKRLKVIDGPRPKAQSKSPVKIFVITRQGAEVHGLTPDQVAALIKSGVL